MSRRSTTAYEQEDYLLLSGLQHFKFCRRRWALIHIEQQWAENVRTIDGALLHANAHNKDFHESRGDLVVTRGMSVHSAELGVCGECDVVEFHRSPSGVPLKGHDGLWQPFPVEYKRGSYNERAGDSLQLCGQAMCLEQMLGCDVSEGALYFGETHHRVTIPFTQESRQQVCAMLGEMHELYRRAYTPRVRPTKSCNACSMKEQCLPTLMRSVSASEYLSAALREELL